MNIYIILVNKANNLDIMSMIRFPFFRSMVNIFIIWSTFECSGAHFENWVLDLILWVSFKLLEEQINIQVTI